MNIDYLAIAPEIVLAVTALVVMGVDLVVSGPAKQIANPLAGIGTLVALVLTATLWGDGRTTFDGSYVVNDYAVVLKLLFLGTLLAILAISQRYFAEGRYFQGEYYFLLITSFLGMILMPSARDLLLLFVALETVSIPAFVLAGLRKRDLYSSEAALKFFLIGVLSVALMLFGMSLVYGFTGTTSLSGIADSIAAQGQAEPLLLASVMLVIVGFGFKISAVPFHFWAPDTYAGSPMPVAAMLAVASKAAGFAGLLAITFIAFEPLADVWAPVLGVLAILTMTLGNLIALQQRDIVRLLAYSSVAQAGYMLIPFGLARSGASEVNDAAVQAVVFYLIAYAVMNVGAFGVAIAVNRRTGHRALSHFEGLGSRHPVLAIALTTFLLSLGGAPPTVGLWAKFSIIQAAAQASTVFGYVLVAFLVVNSVIAFFYYLRVIWLMWMRPERAGAPAVQPGFSLAAVVTLLMIGTVVLGVLPGLISDYSAATSLVAVR
jgi:NADH-quinone oxidoreductase subunit N